VVQESAFKTAEQLFVAIVNEFINVVDNGNLARNLQKAATTSNAVVSGPASAPARPRTAGQAEGCLVRAQALTAVLVEKDFTPPSTYMVNGIATQAVPASNNDKDKNAMPVSVIVPSVVGGLVILAAMFYYGR
jgi:hypothetical protein